MLSLNEIDDLKNCVTTGDVWWNDGHGTCRQVKTITLNGVAFYDHPDDTEPAALLVDGGVIELKNVDMESFVVLRPCLSAEGQPDSLTVLQSAHRGGLVVNFMTGDMSLPKHLMPPR